MNYYKILQKDFPCDFTPKEQYVYNRVCHTLNQEKSTDFSDDVWVTLNIRAYSDSEKHELVNTLESIKWKKNIWLKLEKKYITVDFISEIIVDVDMDFVQIKIQKELIPYICE